LKRLRLTLVILLVPAVAAGGGLLWLSLAPSGDRRPHPFNHDRNAVWLEHRWLEREHGDAEMEALFTGLKERGVAYVFPHLIPFNAAGRLPVHARRCGPSWPQRAGWRRD
jgi:hypothetical protein